MADWDGSAGVFQGAEVIAGRGGGWNCVALASAIGRLLLGIADGLKRDRVPDDRLV
jgi:hypothetical protein